MPLDAICIDALRRELDAALIGARIDKVQQPARDMIILSVHGERGNFRLLISCGTGTARVHITQGGFENPQSPPMFCMLLRKHLIGARITGVAQPEAERMLTLELNALDEMGESVNKRLIIEMMGRNSNIILTGLEGHIIDALRRVDGEKLSRQVLPGLIYRMPPGQDKGAFFLLSETEIREICAAMPGDRAADKWLLDRFSGLSPLICREMCFRVCGDASAPVSAAGREAFVRELVALRGRVESGDYEPTMLMNGDTPQDFSFMPIRQYESALELRRYPDFSALLDEFFTARDRRGQLERRSQTLMKSVKSAHERAARKLALRREELRNAENREHYRKLGDLVTANLYRMKKGERILECEDYFEDGAPTVKIPLDELKTPQQNAARFYRDYNKAKTAETYLRGLIEKGEREEAYLASVIDEIARAENERDIAEIRRELTETGFIREQKNARREKQKPAAPLRFVSSTGMEIFVGRNNTQNDELTKKARRSDIWLHVQKRHGSHVIISCNDRMPDAQTLQEAAKLAVYYSQSRDAGKVPVDYTQVKNVKKPPGSLPGAAVYTEFGTIDTE